MIAALSPAAAACAQSVGELHHARPLLAFRRMGWSLSAAIGAGLKLKTQQKGKSS